MSQVVQTNTDEVDRLLARVAALFDGIVPNLYRVLARNPVTLRAFVDLETALDTAPVLGNGAHALIALEVAVRAGCRYCEGVFVKEAAAAGIAKASVDAVRRGGQPAVPADAVVVEATRRLIESDGRLGHLERARFREAGIGQAELLEMLTVIATYSLATRANNLARTRIDPEYRLDP
ncbi:MAG: carboxymuconolactone decarboxylase family protein [Pseudomonadota bacterium]